MISQMIFTWGKPCSFACETLWLWSPERAASAALCFPLRREDDKGSLERRTCCSRQLGAATLHQSPHQAQLWEEQLHRLQSSVFVWAGELKAIRSHMEGELCGAAWSAEGWWEDWHTEQQQTYIRQMHWQLRNCDQRTPSKLNEH